MSFEEEKLGETESGVPTGASYTSNFEEIFPPKDGVPKVLYDAMKEVWNKGKNEGIEDYKQKVREAIEKLNPNRISQMLSYQSLDDLRKTLAYYLALDDLKKELEL